MGQFPVAPSFDGSWAGGSTSLRLPYSGELRCPGVAVLKSGAETRCGRLLAHQITAPYRITCPRCKHTITVS